MGLRTAPSPAADRNLHEDLEAGGGYLPEHLSTVGPHGWHSHWHAERLKGEWSSLANDCALVLKEAATLQLAPPAIFITQYTQTVAEMHFTLQHEPEISADIFRLIAPDLQEKIQLLRDNFEGNEVRNDQLLSRLMDRLEKRFDAFASSPTESYVRMEAWAKDTEWLNAQSLSVEGLNRYLENLRSSGADAGAVFLRDSQGKLVKLAEYLPPWSQNADDEPISYDMLSSTKLVTGLLCHIAASRQLLNLDQPIVEILNDTRHVFPEGWGQITPRHLLNQASGLARNIRYDTDAGTDSLSLHLAVPLEHKPGTCLRYSNAGTQLLGFVLDAALRRASYGHESPVMDFAQNYLFEPLGMRQTSLSTVWDYPQIPLTDRGIQSTPDDFARLATALLNPETVLGPDNLPLLSRDEQRKLFQPASASLALTGPGELDQDFTQRDNYANGFYIKPYGFAARGTYNTNLDVVFANDLRRDSDAQVAIDEITSTPCLVFVRQQTDAGIKDLPGSEDLEKLMTEVWQKQLF